MTNENIVMKIQSNYREYLVKAVNSIIPLSIGIIGIIIGIIPMMNPYNSNDILISLGVLLVSIIVTFVFAGRCFAFYLKSNKAKKTSINITNERIYGTNVNLNIDIEISAILSVNIEEASTDVDSNGAPKTFKIDSFSKMCALNSKYLNIRTIDGKNIYIDCVDSIEATKNTIDSIIAKNMASRKETNF